MEQKFQTVYGVRLYPLEYLMNEDLNDEDLSWLFDQKSLLYSIIIGMFRFIGIKKSNSEIIKLVRKDPKWMYKYFWNSNEQQEFEDKLIKIMKNIYYLSDFQAKQKAQWYIIIYGLSIKGSNIDL